MMLESAIAAIDAANAADPTTEAGQPAALLYGQRMSVELASLIPAPSEVLQIAARGQHIERWLLPRQAFPEGRTGYLEWRREQGRRHAARVGEIMIACGYGADLAERAGVLLRKEGIKRDPEVQDLEDVICFTFLRHYVGGFAEGRSLEQLSDILRKTARKMSASARARAVVEFALPPDLAAILQDPDRG